MSDDCMACVRHLIAEGRVDPSRVAIKGGSAGGYTTLAALTFTNVFRAGASLYGIGDLKALAEDTHKFESRYLDTLLGGPDAVHGRSPINHVDKLNCPVIFLQGADDKVVAAEPGGSDARRTGRKGHSRRLPALRGRGVTVSAVPRTYAGRSKPSTRSSPRCSASNPPTTSRTSTSITARRRGRRGRRGRRE